MKTHIKSLLSIIFLITKPTAGLIQFHYLSTENTKAPSSHFYCKCETEQPTRMSLTGHLQKVTVQHYLLKKELVLKQNAGRHLSPGVSIYFN